ncbi:MAG: type I methionyl aminopeptidase [Candidatus Omnitrophota bacterium]|nr:MAG: type I methionyl aminopeptidase [Candidatus Omnitrophota bacterium]
MVKSIEEIKKIEIACRKSKYILMELGKMIRPNISTKMLEIEAEKLMKKENVISAFKGYRNYPASICISVNEEVVHGIPSESKILKEGDIVSIDVGVIYEGYYGDCAYTFKVGKVEEKYEKLLEVTKTALLKGIEKAIAGNRVGDISSTIQRFVESNGFSVVREFAGHGVGRSLHEYPEIPNFGEPGKGEILKENMTIAIEPMVNEGSPWIKILSDGWTVVTEDNKRSAHFEDTVWVRKGKPVILTKI